MIPDPDTLQFPHKSHSKGQDIVIFGKKPSWSTLLVRVLSRKQKTHLEFQREFRKGLQSVGGWKSESRELQKPNWITAGNCSWQEPCHVTRTSNSGRRPHLGTRCPLRNRDNRKGCHLQSWESGRDTASSKDITQRRKKEKCRKRPKPSLFLLPHFLAVSSTGRTWPRSLRNVVCQLLAPALQRRVETEY